MIEFAFSFENQSRNIQPACFSHQSPSTYTSRTVVASCTQNLVHILQQEVACSSSDLLPADCAQIIFLCVLVGGLDLATRARPCRRPCRSTPSRTCWKDSPGYEAPRLSLSRGLDEVCKFSVGLKKTGVHIYVYCSYSTVLVWDRNSELQNEVASVCSPHRPSFPRPNPCYCLLGNCS